MNGNELSYVIVNYNDSETTIKCVEKIREYKIINHIVVVDNCSTDNSYMEIKKLECDKVKVILSDKNGGYGYGNNFGAKYTAENYNSDYIIIGNPDAFIEEESIESCLNFIKENEKCGCVVPLMYDANGNPNYRCVWRIPTYYEYAFFSLIVGKTINFYYDKNSLLCQKSFKCDCVAGSWLMMRTGIFNNEEIYDENIFLYCEETVLGIKLKEKGYTSYLLTDAKFLHLHAASIKKTYSSILQTTKLMWESRLYVLDKYYNWNIFSKIVSRIARMFGILEKKIINIR